MPIFVDCVLGVSAHPTLHLIATCGSQTDKNVLVWCPRTESSNPLPEPSVPIQTVDPEPTDSTKRKDSNDTVDRSEPIYQNIQPTNGHDLQLLPMDTVSI